MYECVIIRRSTEKKPHADLLSTKRIEKFFIEFERLISMIYTVYWIYLLIGFYVLVIYFFCFSYSCVRQTKLASSLVNFWAHEKNSD